MKEMVKDSGSGARACNNDLCLHLLYLDHRSLAASIYLEYDDYGSAIVIQ